MGLKISRFMYSSIKHTHTYTPHTLKMLYWTAAFEEHLSLVMIVIIFINIGQVALFSVHDTREMWGSFSRSLSSSRIVCFLGYSENKFENPCEMMESQVNCIHTVPNRNQKWSQGSFHTQQVKTLAFTILLWPNFLPWASYFNETKTFSKTGLYRFDGCMTWQVRLREKEKVVTCIIIAKQSVSPSHLSQMHTWSTSLMLWISRAPWAHICPLCKSWVLHPQSKEFHKVQAERLDRRLEECVCVCVCVCLWSPMPGFRPPG